MAPQRSKKNFTTTITAFKKLMQEKKAYEQTIASKLEALPVPDMADAIWARIERQLDLDMPENDGGGNNGGPASPPLRSWIGKAGIFIFVTALVLSFLLYTNRKNKSAVPGTTITNELSVKKTDSLINTVSPSTQSEERMNPPRSTTQLPGATAIPLDTMLNLAAGPVPYPIDTTQKFTAVLPPQLKPAIDTTPLKRKSRGVQGINEQDYRIVPSRDST
jgi:hypothetical protein